MEIIPFPKIMLLILIPYFSIFFINQIIDQLPPVLDVLVGLKICFLCEHKKRKDFETTHDICWT